MERWTTTPNFLGKLLGRTPEVPEPDEELESMRAFLTNRLSCMDTFMEEFYASKGEPIQWN